MKDSRIQPIIVVCICLIFLLGISQLLFKDQFRTVSLINNDINSFKEFKAYKDKYAYSLPEDWSTQEEQFPGNVILHHNSFKNDNIDMNGYIQIINASGGIDSLIKQDNDNLKSKDIQGYNIKYMTINNRPAKKVGYIEKLENGKYYTKRVYYIDMEDSIVFKGCFNINSDNYNESLDSVYETIMESGKYL